MKLKFELTAKELVLLGNAIAEGCRADVDLTTIKDRRIRKLARENYEAKHRLWLKIIHIADKQK